MSSMINTTSSLLLACALAFAGTGVAHAQSVALSGLLGSKALLVVDGSAPKSVGVGQSHMGVKVVSLQTDQAVVEVAGQQQTLRLGEGPVSAGGATRASSNGKIVLHAISNGHFLAQGQINGRAISLMVDTGASVVGISEEDAQRIGLNYKLGQPVRISTANGSVIGWRVSLNSVRLGSVDVFNVDAVVTPGAMPYVLLGNSFLTRFQMTRTNDELVLEKRY
jgi:aspartyl protease family protein